jgi:hypothetical protein
MAYAAQEARVIRRRDREFQDDLVKKYYTEQRNSDAAARDALKAPVKRREREGKERQAEIDMLESMYRVSICKLDAASGHPSMSAINDDKAPQCRVGSKRNLHSSEQRRRMIWPQQCLSSTPKNSVSVGRSRNCMPSTMF